MAKEWNAPDIGVKRVYDPAAPQDGARVLIDRLWPRGLGKEKAALTLWLKEIAPSVELRTWFGHDPARWVEFSRRYRAELADNNAAVAQVAGLLKHGRVTLLYAAHDSAHNHALVLAAYLRERWNRDDDGRPDANAELPAETASFASPACLAHEVDGRYMGFAPRDELLPALNELLEAERAGARVTLRTAAEAPDDVRPLIMAIHRDEAHWCGVLTKAIRRLGGTPSSKTGAFHDKALAIDDLAARLAFLNRGQGWVARKLKALLPTIRDDRIHADLGAMLESHEQNIALVAARIEPP